MAFSTSSNRHLGLNEEELEAARLKNMLRESILKVERENMESIRKEALHQKTAPESKNSITSVSQKSIPKVAVNKSSVFLKKGPISLHAKSPDSKKSHENPSNLPTKPVFQTATASCPFSNVHFLNHFQSSYLSAKPPSRIKYFNESDDCLSPNPTTDTFPTWKHVPEYLYKNNNHAIPVVQNTKRVYKNLTVQSLPSISINGQNTNEKRNVLMEEIKEKSHSADSCVKTTNFPLASQASKTEFQTKNIQSKVVKDSSIYTDKGVQVSGQPKISVFTQSSNNVKEVTDYKEYVKELVRESLKEFQLESYQRLHTGTGEKESRIIPHNNDCDLDSFIGGAPPNLCDDNCMPNKEVSKESISTQTNFGTNSLVLDKAQMRDFMKEFLHDYKQAASVDIPEKPSIPEVMMVQQETQTNNQSSGSSQNVSKEVQVSILPESQEYSQASIHVMDTPVIEHSDKMTDTSTLTMENIYQSTSHQPVISTSSPLPPVSSRLEFMINSIYEHFCKSKPEPSVISSKLSGATTSTSVQSDPILTASKSTHTSQVTQANAANQCDLFSTIDNYQSTSYQPVITKSTSVQTQPPTPLCQKVDSSVQSVKATQDTCTQCVKATKDTCTQSVKASRDTCTQTFESFLHSERSSVSSTPVSDSMFLDDMLSEGEVVLPWNLRLLSHADKSHPQSGSNVAAEESCSSDRERDYSLSEGEIPPNYTLPLNLAACSYDSGSDTNASSAQPKTTPLSPLNEISRQTSMSDGEVRYSLSQGEVTRQTVPKRYCQSTDTATVLGERTPLNVGSGDSGSHTPLHSSFGESEGEVSRIQVPSGVFNVPRGLFTVTEEK